MGLPDVNGRIEPCCEQEVLCGIRMGSAQGSARVGVECETCWIGLESDSGLASGSGCGVTCWIGWKRRHRGFLVCVDFTLRLTRLSSFSPAPGGGNPASTLLSPPHDPAAAAGSGSSRPGRLKPALPALSPPWSPSSSSLVVVSPAFLRRFLAGTAFFFPRTFGSAAQL